MTSRTPRQATPPVRILTDGHGRYYVPVFEVGPDGMAVYVGTAVYRDVTTDVTPLGVPKPRTHD